MCCSKNKFISELFPKIMFLQPVDFIESVSLTLVSTAAPEKFQPVNLRISASNTPIEL